MSTDFFPTRRIDWAEMVAATVEELVIEPSQNHEQGRAFLIRHEQGGAIFALRSSKGHTDATYFEAFGQNQSNEVAGKMLRALGSHFGCEFVDELGQLVVDGDVNSGVWSDPEIAAAEEANGREIPLGRSEHS